MTERRILLLGQGNGGSSEAKKRRRQSRARYAREQGGAQATTTRREVLSVLELAMLSATLATRQCNHFYSMILLQEPLGRQRLRGGCRPSLQRCAVRHQTLVFIFLLFCRTGSQHQLVTRVVGTCRYRCPSFFALQRDNRVQAFPRRIRCSPCVST